MIINHNIAALNTYRQLSNNGVNTQKSLAKLSSGLRINKAGDDAAGLAISEKMRGQIRGLDQASRNAQDGISMIQTAEGALNESHSILQRMRELAVQSANNTNTSTDRKEIQKEVDQLTNELTRISNDTEFNTQSLLNGGIKEGNIGNAVFQIGANQDQNINLSINAMDAKSLGLTEDVKSVSAKLSATDAGLIGADIGDDSHFTEGQYTIEVNAAGDTATLKNSAGEEIATASGTFDGTDATMSFSSTKYGTLTVTTDGATDLTSTSHTLTISASGADVTTASTGVTAIQVKSGTMDAGTGYKLDIYDSDGAGTMKARVLNADSKVISTADVALTDNSAIDITVENSDGSNATLTFTVKGTAPASAEQATFSITNSDYTSGLSEAASFKVDSATGNNVLDEKASVVKGIDVRTQPHANDAITKIQSAIEKVSAERSKLGAYQNRLEHTINNLGTSSENLTAAESRIRDVDMAKEMMEFTKNNILSQAAQAMLAQANQQPQGVLQLLR